jgi:hypothetical protein
MRRAAVGEGRHDGFPAVLSQTNDFAWWRHSGIQEDAAVIWQLRGEPFALAALSDPMPIFSYLPISLAAYAFLGRTTFAP